MNDLLFYLAGALLVWMADKRVTYETGWVVLVTRIGISLLSWISIILFLVISLCEYIGRVLEKKYNYKLPKWL